jgi:hypothetical protein
VVVLLAIGTAPAHGQGVNVVGTTVDPELTEIEAGGWTVSIQLLNLTTATRPLSVTPLESDAACTPTIQPNEIRQAPVKATVTIAATCKEPPAEGVRFAIVAGGDEPGHVAVEAKKPKEDEKPDWEFLELFWWLAGGGWLIGLLLASIRGSLPRGDAPTYNLFTPLDGLGPTWDFKDSWVSNVTVVAGLLTGIVGSSTVLGAVLGDDAENSMALATVGAAIAAGLVAFGPIFLILAKRKRAPTVLGVVTAAALVLAGAAGQIWVTAEAGSELDLDGAEDMLYPFAAILSAALVVYALRSLDDLIADGVAETPPAESDAMKAARWVAAAIRGEDPPPDLGEATDKILEAYEEAEKKNKNEDAEEAPVRRRGRRRRRRARAEALAAVPIIKEAAPRRRALML